MADEPEVPPTEQRNDWGSEPWALPGGPNLIIGTWIVFTVSGAILGVVYMEPDTWPLWRRLFAGTLGGMASALCLTAGRIIRG